MRLVDLHTHTVVSDGTLTPAQLAAAAARAGLAAIAVTDHDHVGGVREAREAGARCGVEVVSGVELSVAHRSAEVHLLAYLLDEEDPAFLARLERLRETRDARNARIVERLRALGLHVTMQDVLAEAGGGSVGRPHVARALVARGAVATVQEAFDKYLAEGRAAFVPRARLSPRDAIGIVHAARGVAVLAHPGLLDAPAAVVREMAALGLDGVEVWHPKNGPELRMSLLALAKELSLVATGGSDFHGENKPDVKLGQEKVGYDVLESLRARR